MMNTYTAKNWKWQSIQKIMRSFLVKQDKIRGINDFRYYNYAPWLLNVYHTIYLVRAFTDVVSEEV